MMALSQPDFRAMVKEKKRESLKQTLINKFRVKYNVRAGQDNFEAIIRDEVQALLHSNALSEADLVQLDKRLKQRLSANPEEAENLLSRAPNLQSSASQR